MVPTSCAKSHSITSHTKATNTLFVTRKITHSGRLDGIPNTHTTIIIPSKQISAGVRESDRGDTAQDILVIATGHLAARSDRKETASGVVRPSPNKVTIREEGNRVNIRLVTAEGLLALARVDVPNLHLGVTSTRDKEFLVRGQGQAKKKRKKKKRKEKKKKRGNQKEGKKQKKRNKKRGGIIGTVSKKRKVKENLITSRAWPSKRVST